MLEQHHNTQSKPARQVQLAPLELRDEGTILNQILTIHPLLQSRQFQAQPPQTDVIFAAQYEDIED